MYSITILGPHHTRMGNREQRQVLTTVRSDCGHEETGPSAVFDQSVRRISRAISLSPGKIDSSGSAAESLMMGV